MEVKRLFCIICRKKFKEGEMATMTNFDGLLIPIHYRCRNGVDNYNKIRKLGKLAIENDLKDGLSEKEGVKK